MYKSMLYVLGLRRISKRTLMQQCPRYRSTVVNFLMFATFD